jgi:hypothetical protein
MPARLYEYIEPINYCHLQIEVAIRGYELRRNRLLILSVAVKIFGWVMMRQQGLIKKNIKRALSANGYWCIAGTEEFIDFIEFNRVESRSSAAKSKLLVSGFNLIKLTFWRAGLFRHILNFSQYKTGWLFLKVMSSIKQTKVVTYGF